MPPTRTWEYGTRKPGQILSVMQRGTILALVFVEHGDDQEAFTLFGGDAMRSVKEGDTGEIVFTKGGPTGGYWVFVPASKPETV